jgi:hypothetical protein
MRRSSRRRAAADPPLPSSTVFDSESDPDGQGAAELYDNDGEEGVYGTVKEEECGDVFEERKAGGVSGGGGEVELVTGKVAVAPEDEGRYAAPEDEGKYEEESVVEGEEEEEAMKGGVVKGDEACAVPTAGAFYQHDTRFRRHQRF